VQILFSAHALPQKFIDNGDPYLKHVEATVQGVMQRVGHPDWHLAFQSRSGPVRWMEPDTVEKLKELAAAGHNAVLMVPVSFVSDHIETLQEIDIQYRDLAFELGLQNYRRVASLNDDDDFLGAMAGLVEDHLRKAQ